MIGIPQSRMIKEYKGEVVYNQEVRLSDLFYAQQSSDDAILLG